MRFEQYDKVCVSPRKCANVRQNETQRNEGNVYNGNVRGYGKLGEVSNVGLFKDRDPGIRPYVVMELIGAYVNRIDPLRALPQQLSGKPAGPAAHVEGCLSRAVYLKRLQDSRQLTFAAPDTERALRVYADLRVGVHWSGGSGDRKTVNLHAPRANGIDGLFTAGEEALLDEEAVESHRDVASFAWFSHAEVQ